MKIMVYVTLWSWYTVTMNNMPPTGKGVDDDKELWGGGWHTEYRGLLCSVLGAVIVMVVGGGGEEDWVGEGACKG